MNYAFVVMLNNSLLDTRPQRFSPLLSKWLIWKPPHSRIESRVWLWRQVDSFSKQRDLRPAGSGEEGGCGLVHASRGKGTPDLLFCLSPRWLGVFCCCSLFWKMFKTPYLKDFFECCKACSSVKKDVKLSWLRLWFVTRFCYQTRVPGWDEEALRHCCPFPVLRKRGACLLITPSAGWFCWQDCFCAVLGKCQLVG